MIKKALLFISLVLVVSLLHGQDSLTNKEQRKQKKDFLLNAKPWTIEVPLWIPGFAGSFAYGGIKIQGEDGEGIGNPIEPFPPPDWKEIFNRVFSTRWYLKFFFMTRIAYEKNKFIAQFDAITGAVGESTQFNFNSRQVVQANFRTVNMRLLAGFKFMEVAGKNRKFRYELFGYLGARAHFQKIYSDLDGLINRLDINPVWFEPIVGIQNQLTWKRWFIVLMGDYGGYFVPEKHSLQITGFVYYRSGKITSLKAGWNHLVLNHKGTFRNEDYRVNVSLSGPTIGIALHF